MDIKDLDGTYRVTTISDYDGPVPMQSDGQTVVKDGMTSRIDKARVKWTTRITPVSETEVLFESLADPSDAAPDFCLIKPNGDLTRDPVTYTTRLQVARKGDKIKLSGQIDHGKIKTILTMIKI